MSLERLLSRSTPPAPFEEFDNIPWNDPAFSERMLEYHLDQANDLASRRPSIIDAQVAWIHETLCREAPTRILDLGCGPGLYANRLAARGHTVDGIDYSPASIAYARAQKVSGTTFTEADFRSVSFDSDYDIAMMIYGEFNVFSLHQASELLAKIANSLKPGGMLLLEINSIGSLRGLADTPASFSVLESGLFSPRPHLLLDEAFWNEPEGILTKRYTVIDVDTAAVDEYGTSYQTWTDVELSVVLEDAGLSEMRILSDMCVDAGFDGFIAVATRK